MEEIFKIIGGLLALVLRLAVSYWYVIVIWLIVKAIKKHQNK